MPWKQCVTTSPGRSCASSSGSGMPMSITCTISGSPSASAASSASADGRPRIGPDHLVAGAQLDAGDHVAVGLGDAHALLDRGPADVLELADEPRDHALDGDVEVGVDARLRLLDDHPAQPGERLRARRSHVDARRRAAPQQVACRRRCRSARRRRRRARAGRSGPGTTSRPRGVDALAALRARRRPRRCARRRSRRPRRASTPVAGQSTWPPATTRSCVTESGPRPAGARAQRANARAVSSTSSAPCAIESRPQPWKRCTPSSSIAHCSALASGAGTPALERDRIVACARRR